MKLLIEVFAMLVNEIEELKNQFVKQLSPIKKLNSKVWMELSLFALIKYYSSVAFALATDESSESSSSSESFS
jgi:hypothetical protein